MFNQQVFAAWDLEWNQLIHGDLNQMSAFYMSPESYEKIWKENFLLSGIHSLV